jgi:hypothetical protein
MVAEQHAEIMLIGQVVSQALLPFVQMHYRSSFSFVAETSVDLASLHFWFAFSTTPYSGLLIFCVDAQYFQMFETTTEVDSQPRAGSL